LKKIFILLAMLITGISQLYSQNYTYELTAPVDIDAIPGNIIVKDGVTHHIRSYQFAASITDNHGVPISYIEKRVVPISNTGLHGTLIFKKTFDHKVGDYGGCRVTFAFCDDEQCNNFAIPPSSMYESFVHKRYGNFHKPN
jgi:hypothetical protein